MALLTPHFSANRTVREYTEKHYISAAANFKSRITNGRIEAKKLTDWQHHLDKDWDKIHFEEIRVVTKGDQHIFEIDVYLSSIEPDEIKVELYADSINGFTEMKQEMKPLGKHLSASNNYTFGVKVPSSRPATDYTARIIPYYENIVVPLEARQIVWQK